MSGIISPFATLAKSSAARGRFDSLLEINFYNISTQRFLTGLTK